MSTLPAQRSGESYPDYLDRLHVTAPEAATLAAAAYGEGIAQGLRLAADRDRARQDRERGGC